MDQTNKRQSHEMVKHTQTICRQIADELFECIWSFWGLVLKELKSITSALQKNHEEIELSNDVSQQFSFLLLYNFVYGHTRKITGGNREKKFISPLNWL